jgi:nitroreductase
MTAAFLEAMRKRYREEVGAPGQACSQTVEVMLGHRSIRAFSDRPLPGGTLETLVAAGQSASTSSNKQLWSVIAVENAARKERLAFLSDQQSKIAQAPLFLVFLADHARVHAIAAAKGEPAQGLDYLESFLVAVVDAALAAQNVAVAAESLGLGIVFIGATRSQPEAVAEELGLPQSCFALFGLCVGYPAEAIEAQVKPRLPQAAVLHRETYSPQAIAPAVARYDRHSVEFRREQALEPLEWTKHILQRLRSADSLKGRSRLKDTLVKLGFPMK